MFVCNEVEIKILNDSRQIFIVNMHAIIMLSADAVIHFVLHVCKSLERLPASESKTNLMQQYAKESGCTTYRSIILCSAYMLSKQKVYFVASIVPYIGPPVVKGVSNQTVRFGLGPYPAYGLQKNSHNFTLLSENWDTLEHCHICKKIYKLYG